MSIQSVSRAFTILKTVAHHPNGIGVTELARRMNVHKSTVSRLLSTLEEEEAVERLPNGNGFRIGSGISALIPSQTYSIELSRLLRPLLHELANVTGESSGISIPDGHTSVTVEQLPSKHAVRVRDWTGERFPLHVSSSGKHYLARWPKKRLEEYMSKPLISYTPFSLVDPEELTERLDHVRQTGYDWTENEFEVGLAAVSVPVCDDYDQPFVVMYLSGPTFRFPKDGNVKPIASILFEAASRAKKILNNNNIMRANHHVTAGLEPSPLA